MYTEIGLYQATIRPQGSMHWEFNDHCESAVFVASLGNEDPGVSRSAQNFFINPQDVVEADLSYPDWLVSVNTTDFRAVLPAAFAQGAKVSTNQQGRLRSSIGTQANLAFINSPAINDVVSHTATTMPVESASSGGDDGQNSEMCT